MKTGGIFVLVSTALLVGVACAKPASNAFLVTPGRQVELSFRARVAAGPTLEEHPEYAELVAIAVSRPTVTDIRFAAVNWTFHDAGGKKVSRPYEGGQPVTLFSRDWRSFSERIWIPEGVTSVKVHPVPGDKANRVELADVAVRELSDDGVLFSTHVFDDIYFPSGWRLVGEALYLTDADGRGFIATEAGHANGSVFPVVPGSRIRVKVFGSVSLRADKPKFNCWMNFAPDYAAMSQAKGFKKSLAPATITGKKTSVEREFVVPEGMTWARVAVWSGELRGMEVIRN